MRIAKEKTNDILTIPNLLGFYRLLAFPLILYFIFSGKESLFAIFLVINLLTDVVDGFIARKFNMETEFGARLDSFADNLTYVSAFTGLLVFKWAEIGPYQVSFFIFMGFLLSTVPFSLIRFGKFASFHLYMFKIGGYIQGVFFICLFTVGFIEPLYYFMITWGILAAIEHMLIIMIIPERRSNVKGLYWVLKDIKSKENPE